MVIDHRRSAPTVAKLVMGRPGRLGNLEGLVVACAAALTCRLERRWVSTPVAIERVPPASPIQSKVAS